MAISYNKLWKLLVDKGMKKKDLKVNEFFNPSVGTAKNQVFSVPNEKRCYLFPSERTKDANGVSHIKSATILFYT